MRYFEANATAYRNGDSQDIESNCSAITFKNKGATTATINGYPLDVGETIAITGLLPDDILMTKYKLVFGSTANTEVVFVWRSIYKKS